MSERSCPTSAFASGSSPAWRPSSGSPSITGFAWCVAESGWWARPLARSELVGWVFAILGIGLVLTGALGANNLATVREGDPTLPFMLAGIGYPALAAVTFAFAVRFLRSQEGGAQTAS